MSNGTKERSTGIVLALRTPLKHPGSTIPKRRSPPFPVLLPRRNEAQFNPTSWKTCREEGCGRLEGVRSGWRHNVAEDRKRIRCAACGPSHLCSLRARASPGEAASNPPKPPPLASPDQAASTAPSSSSLHKLPYLDCARTCTFSCACEPSRFWNLKAVAAGAWTRVEAVRGGPKLCWGHERRQRAGARSRKGEREEEIEGK